MSPRAGIALATIVAARPVLAAAHSGIATPRTGPEWSDLALAVFAAGAVWFVRRALRARFARNTREG